ncbi:MAG: carboxypeptidase-like regulatory domain-containing protein [Ferruginibacter sp.]
MKKIFTLILFILPACIFAQNSLKDIRKQSWQSLVFSINSSEAEQYIKWDSIPINNFLNREPIKTSDFLLADEDELPVGSYIVLKVIDNNISAALLNISNLRLVAINNKRHLQLEVRDKQGNNLTSAKLYVNNKEESFNKDSKTFWIKGRKLEDAEVIVYAAGDTLFSTLDLKDDYNRLVSEQKRNNYKSTKIYKVLNWLPSKIGNLFQNTAKREKPIGARGYIIFNQPKYKPLDTVKYKAYIVNKKWKQYHENVDAYISYYYKNRSVEQLLAELKPLTPGAFTGQFILSDTIPSDISITLSLKTKSKKNVITDRVKVEDYVLDEIGSYNFRSQKDTYFSKDSMLFFANAKDANGLNLLDATARLQLITNTIDKTYQDSLFVIDTLYVEEKKLITNGDTRFAIPANILPNADLKIKAKLIFKNSNNELHEEQQAISYNYSAKKLFIQQDRDSIRAFYLENGISKEVAGTMYMNYEKEVPIHYPASLKIDPVAEDYTFYFENTSDTLTAKEEIDDNYRLSFSRISSGDTLGFILNNPYRIPVYYTILNGKKLITTGQQSSEEVTWKKIMKDRRQAYRVSWQYFWGGKENYYTETIGLLYKLLNIKIDASQKVYPGQKDSIKIHITDYKGNAAKNVNLTAVSYNNQFKNASVKEPPYLVKYKSRHFIDRESFETDEDIFLQRKYLLGKNTEWIKKFGLDTMVYYKLLFPSQKYYDAVTPIQNFIPQVSVNVVKKGVPQEIYLLYINRELVYYNGVTDKMNNAYEAYPENVQIGIRLRDKFVTIDSLYFQPKYKHDMSFDIENLPAHSTITDVKNYWDTREINLLEQTIWQMQNDYQNNNSYLWQDKKLVKLSGNNEHTAGPFGRSEMTFYNQGNFDISYNFEPGYQYKISKQIIRLEKKSLFPAKIKNIYLPIKNSAGLNLGDTLVEHPYISYPVKENKFLLANRGGSNYYRKAEGLSYGRLQLNMNIPKDSILRYIILEPLDTANKRIIIETDNYSRNFASILPGVYNLFFATNNLYAYQYKDITIKADGTEFINIDSPKFTKNLFTDKLYVEAKKSLEYHEEDNLPIKEDKRIENLPSIRTGSAMISGIVVDKKGQNPIEGVAIRIQGSRTGTSSNSSGQFSLKNIWPGEYILEISGVGYEKKEVRVEADSANAETLRLQLTASSSALQEVIVTAMGISRKKSSLGYSTSNISANELTSGLAGKIAGLTIDNYSASPGLDASIQIRGNAGLNGDNKLLYVIDGIVVEDISKLSPDNIASFSILNGSSAIALYGARAMDGVVIISTKSGGGNALRSQFRDYAFWKPNFFTDANGNASFEVTYPDNITGWKTFVIGMDKKRRMGKASIFTQAYKPIVAQLNLPQFLLEGDSSIFIGKSLNHTDDNYSVKTEFMINNISASAQQKDLPANASNIDEQRIIAENTDTLKVVFKLQTTTNFKDGEERKIPVFKKGIEEAIGNFWVLQNDTTIDFKSSPLNTEFNIYAQNNTLDVLLQELDHLKEYPFACMEQTASKVTGLAMEKKIKAQLKQPFKDQRILDKLISKIQKAQLFDGGWAWWENGKANLYITNYVANALLQFRSDPLIETNIRNAFLYLQNQLQFLNRSQALATLSTLSEGKHEMNYKELLDKMPFDSLSQHEQWQYVKIEQQQQLNYQQELKKLFDKKTETILGGMHWGQNNYSWYSNDIATTVIAFNVIKNDSSYRQFTLPVIQYFLEKRKNGYWANTVESATIVNAILPSILEKQSSFSQPAKLTFTGDTSFVINKFPYKLAIKNSVVRNISVHKTGGGLTYLTAYQKIFNPLPQPVEDKFIIETSFQRNSRTVTSISSVEKIKMIVKVNVLKDADYVMLQVPIPAGCIYSNKNNKDWSVYKEFYKDREILFIESLPKGEHEYEIELEPRYNGTYTLNPAKAELMYYPVFYGRNAMKKISIVK